jgi:hypothetical protein
MLESPVKSSFSIVDVMKVRHDQASPEAAVKTFVLPDTDEIKIVECDILIVGGGVGGVAAALASAAAGLKVCITEETDWLGGQMSSQGISVLDEGRNFLIETSGSNRSYQRFRERIRDYYRKNYKLSLESVQNKYFNPGNCWDWVSQLAFEPEVAVKVIDELISKTAGLQVFLRCSPIKVECNGNHIERVLTVNLDTAQWTAFKAAICVDATELGDLLALSGARYNLGAEARDDMEEPHAGKIADPENVQDYVFPFIVEFAPNTNNVIAKPSAYDSFNRQGKFSLCDYKMFEFADKTGNDGVSTGNVKHSGTVVEQLMPFWTYRRILDKTAFDDPRISNDAAVINWFAGNDLRGHNIIDKPPAVVSRYLSLAKALSLSFLYWLQTEAPRDEGGKGYPEIKLKRDALGTEDGLSKYPYIRESRRGLTFTCIKEQDIVGESNSAARARIFNDSAGIGFFPIDIHGQETEPATLKTTKHFQIPLGALLTEFPSNLVLACKNIGTTHITNGAYRLHPIEWAIGEAAGTLARCALNNKITVHEVLQQSRQLRSFQQSLIEAGVPLYWYDDVATAHPDFEAIQFLSISNIMRGDPGDLHFNPDADLSRQAAAAILSAASAVSDCELSADPGLQLVPPMTRAQFATRLYNKLCELRAL